MAKQPRPSSKKAVKKRAPKKKLALPLSRPPRTAITRIKTAVNRAIQLRLIAERRIFANEFGLNLVPQGMPLQLSRAQWSSDYRSIGNPPLFNGVR